MTIDQFARQAIPFIQNAAHSAEYAVKRLVTLGNVSKNDTVLDVACGSGLVSCELAKMAHDITGIDITPAMIQQANLLKQDNNLDDIKYEIGDVAHVPYPNASFSLVVTRYSFHHLVDPCSGISEMKGFCMRKGRVVEDINKIRQFFIQDEQNDILGVSSQFLGRDSLHICYQ